MFLFNSKIVTVCVLTAALIGCSSQSQGANENTPSGRNAVFADEQYLTTLRDEFQEVSGKDFVEFEKGSAVLSSSAEFRLERQAIWLRAYPMISVRLIAAGDGLERGSDRRLAMARGRAVQKHLTAVGVQPHQISGIEFAHSAQESRQRVTTKFDPIQSAMDE